MKRYQVVGLCAVLWMACERREPEQPPTVLVRIDPAPAVSCPGGGTAILRGADRDGDGQLSDPEVESTEYVCQTAPSVPVVLVRRLPLEPGTPCAAGGTRVEAGTDTNGDGQLDASEVRSTEYVCQNEPTPSPSVLVTQTPEAPGNHCAAGGILVRAGVDTNRDGTLDDAEVERSFYGCQAEPSPVVIRAKAEPAGTNCTLGGVAVQAGTDTDKDGSLGDGEVETTSYVCGEAPEAVLVETHRILSGGTTCPDGGTQILAGTDSDRDGVLDFSEITLRRNECKAKEPGWIYFGDYDIRTAADVVALQGAGRITGALFVRGSEVEQIDLPSLKRVDSSVRIYGNPKLVSFSAAIEELGIYLQVHDNPLLTSFSISGGGEFHGDVAITHNPRLNSLRLGFNPVRIAGSLWVEDNAALQSLSGLSKVRHIGRNLSVARNASLESNGWSLYADYGPTFIGGRLTVAQNPKLSRFISFLETVGEDIQVTENPELFEFGASVQVLPGSLLLQHNPKLYLLPGLEQLRIVGGDLTLERLDALDVLHLDALTHVGGSFSFIGNELVWHFFYVDSLMSIGGNLNLIDNPKLAFLFDNLLAVGGGVRLERNDALVQLGGLGWLARLSSLQILDNAKLHSLSHLRRLSSVDSLLVSGNPLLTRLELPELTSVSWLSITDNPALPTCLATALRAQLSATPGSVTISGNDETSVCP
ncbi:DUF7151 family protein [Cystobacter fuscus]|uniref:DUF7151 family protein n=1 Tax=Cystobacter fuscus TaxID=43 RepID=UPI0012DFDEC4|nr:hypothetical protein [Cystobacter fuscus]